MDVSDARRLKALEEENARLKKLLADHMLDAARFASLLQKNGRARSKTRRHRASEVRLGLHDRRR